MPVSVPSLKCADDAAASSPTALTTTHSLLRSDANRHCIEA